MKNFATMKDTKFHLFPLLPKELRLDIWNLAFCAESRVIEPHFTHKDYPTPSLAFYGVLKWRSYSTASDPPGSVIWTSQAITAPPLLFVCHESRDFLSGSYQKVNICDQSSQPWQNTYVNWSNDTIYVSPHDLEMLHRTATTQRALWINEVRNLAVQAGGKRISGIPRTTRYTRYLNLSNNYSQDTAVLHIMWLAITFPSLRQITVILDGRHESFCGSTELFEPTPEFEDHLHTDGRTMALQRILDLEEHLWVQKPKLINLQIRLGVLINGRFSSELERRWIYSAGGCLFVPLEKPGSETLVLSNSSVLGALSLR
jgi:hypothetical protein